MPIVQKHKEIESLLKLCMKIEELMEIYDNFTYDKINTLRMIHI